MKMKLMFAAILSLVTAAPALGVCTPTVVGLYGEPQAILCSIDSDIYTTTSVYLILTRDWQSPPLESLALDLVGWPGDGEAIVTTVWEHAPVSGAPGSTMTWSWPEGLSGGPVLLLGRIDVFPLIQDWPGENWFVRTEIQSIQDVYQQTPPHAGLEFVFNCAGSVDCNCVWDLSLYNAPDLELAGFSPGPGDVVSGSFELSFHVRSLLCDNYGGGEQLPYTGSVLVNDELVAELAGDESGIEQLTLSTGDLPGGSSFTVRVLLDNGASTEAQLEYTVGTSTGVPDPPTANDARSFSAIKALY
ncbi:MAG: hypothetical protein H6693_08410 [Candidatus Latescibacteria bacterium]|nr:hypothetical protein [Candidatus Latescibacterota bacterium]